MLVAYATAAGSTRGVAERIGIALAGAAGRPALDVVCRPVSSDLEASGFDAFVVGSAVHDMAWLPDAVAFLDRVVVPGRPVWVFSVGGIEPRGPVTRALAARERASVEQGFPRGFVARDHRVFGGIVVRTGVPWWGRVFWRLTGGRPGDHRNWSGIDAWAGSIAAALRAERAHLTGSAD